MTKAQSMRTLKFRKQENGQTAMMVGVSCEHGRTENVEVHVHGGRCGYVWVGSEERGCYIHFPLSSLKRLIASAEAR